MVKKPTIEEALNRIYLIKSNNIHIPDCLIGKNIKLILSSEMEDKLINKDELYKEIYELNKEIETLKTQNKELTDLLEKARKLPNQNK